MSRDNEKRSLSRQRFLVTVGSLLGLTAAAAVYRGFWEEEKKKHPIPSLPKLSPQGYSPRVQIDTSGYTVMKSNLPPWAADASLQEIRTVFLGIGDRILANMDQFLQQPEITPLQRLIAIYGRASIFNYEGNPAQAFRVLEKAHAFVNSDPNYLRESLYTILYFQGVTSLRRGENENCVMCIGQGACILPIAPSAVHTKPDGSQTALQYFTQYLDQFPDDLEVRWLLNLAHMTLGQHPREVNPKYLIPLDHYLKSEFDIGTFRDIGHLLGVNRLNQSGGAIMEDFNNDGLLDIVITTFDATESMAYYVNKGDGTFEDRTEAAGLKGQLGGLNCVQVDYNNDGNMDIFIPRGAWFEKPMRPSLLRNNGDGTFTDVTEEAGLLAGVTSNSACWADYDNDGFLDLFICCETQPNKLYHNNGDGTFTEVAEKAGVNGIGGYYKGATWIDYDNDDYPDLFLNNLKGNAELYRNNRDGTFTNVTTELGIDGPTGGFSCWAWDYDNDGWLDIFATTYDRTVPDIVKGLLGEPHTCHSNKLWHNKQGKGFEDVAKEAGLDMVFATMGSNFGDFDNDGYLDFYLGTGDPEFTTLVPNRMFKNVEGKRFSEITASAGVGNLQKGHGVACGDWDNDGNVDIFIEMGGAVPGDKFHNSLYQNPGQGNNWLTVKLIGKKTNRCAIGARIKAVTDGPSPLTVHRLVSSGSSFGANPLQQTIGVGKAQKVATLEIHWPTSKTIQVFHDIEVNRFIEITEFASEYRRVERKRVTMPG
jgi:hypothetical protein